MGKGGGEGEGLEKGERLKNTPRLRRMQQRLWGSLCARETVRCGCKHQKVWLEYVLQQTGDRAAYTLHFGSFSRMFGLQDFQKALTVACK